MSHDEVGSPVVDVDLGRLRVAGHVDGLAGAHEIRGDPVEIQELPGEGMDEVDRLVPVAGLAMGDPGRDRARKGRDTRGGQGRLAAEEAERSLEESQAVSYTHLRAHETRHDLV